MKLAVISLLLTVGIALSSIAQSNQFSMNPTLDNITPPADTPITYEASRYKSFKHFLDSICYMGKLSPVKKNAFLASKTKTDTLYTKHEVKLVKKMGIVKQYFFSEKGFNINDPGACYSFLGIGSKCFNQDTLMCWQQFNYWPNSLITYKEASFIIMKGGPYLDNCVGGACRINFYPVI